MLTYIFCNAVHSDTNQSMHWKDLSTILQHFFAMFHVTYISYEGKFIYDYCHIDTIFICSCYITAAFTCNVTIMLVSVGIVFTRTEHPTPGLEDAEYLSDKE